MIAELNRSLSAELDRALIALQAAAAARKLYGPAHVVPKRQIATAAEILAAMLVSRPQLRIVRLNQSLFFEDSELSASAHLAETVTPRLISHSIEWIEFRKGVDAPDLTCLLEQLERSSGAIGTRHVRTGRLGGSNDSSLWPETISIAGPDSPVDQFKQIWEQVQQGHPPDQALGELVENIRLAVAVGTDVCKQLADVKSHDEYTFVHTVNVAILSAALGESVGMTPNQGFDLTLAALLHDVGKQRTPLAILNKPGKLDDIERKRMEQHTIDGAAILLARRGVSDVAPIVAFEHHANVDGSGYPHLPGKGRPHMASQIVHVADVFDALRTNRPYRSALEAVEVRRILLEGSGKQFDPDLLSLFLDHVVKVR